MTIAQLVVPVIVGGIAELDRTSVFHGMLSEPIILSPLVGYILGDPVLGLKIGALLQLFFLGMVSVGGSSPPDGAMAAVAVTSAASLATHYTAVPHEVALPVAVLLVMVPAGRIGKAIDARLKESNVALLHKAEDDLETNGAGVVEKAIWKSVLKTFCTYAVAVAVVASAGTLITSFVLAILPQGWWKALEISGSLLMMASAGIALASLRERRAFLVYASVGICLLLLMVGLK